MALIGAVEVFLLVACMGLLVAIYLQALRRNAIARHALEQRDHAADLAEQHHRERRAHLSAITSAIFERMEITAGALAAEVREVAAQLRNDRRLAMGLPQVIAPGDPEKVTPLVEPATPAPPPPPPSRASVVPPPVDRSSATPPQGTLARAASVRPPAPSVPPRPVVLPRPVAPPRPPTLAKPPATAPPRSSITPHHTTPASPHDLPDEPTPPSGWSLERIREHTAAADEKHLR